MEKPMRADEDLAEKPFDPEMTEPDEANAPDDTGRTTDASSLTDGGPDESDDREEVGI